MAIKLTEYQRCLMERLISIEKGIVTNHRHYLGKVVKHNSYRLLIESTMPGAGISVALLAHMAAAPVAPMRPILFNIDPTTVAKVEFDNSRRILPTIILAPVAAIPDWIKNIKLFYSRPPLLIDNARSAAKFFTALGAGVGAINEAHDVILVAFKKTTASFDQFFPQPRAICYPTSKSKSLIAVVMYFLSNYYISRLVYDNIPIKGNMLARENAACCYYVCSADYEDKTIHCADLDSTMENYLLNGAYLLGHMDLFRQHSFSQPPAPILTLHASFTINAVGEMSNLCGLEEAYVDSMMNTDLGHLLGAIKGADGSTPEVLSALNRTVAGLLGDKCPICFETLSGSSVAVMKCCNQSIHFKCLTKCQKSQCPCCRTEYSEKYFSNIAVAMVAPSWVDKAAALMAPTSAPTMARYLKIIEGAPVRKVNMAHRQPHEMLAKYLSDRAHDEKSEPLKLVINIYSASHRRPVTTILECAGIAPLWHSNSVPIIQKNLERFNDANLGAPSVAYIVNSMAAMRGLNLSAATDVINYHHPSRVIPRPVLNLVTSIFRKGRLHECCILGRNE